MESDAARVVLIIKVSTWMMVLMLRVAVTDTSTTAVSIASIIAVKSSEVMTAGIVDACATTADNTSATVRLAGSLTTYTMTSALATTTIMSVLTSPQAVKSSASMFTSVLPTSFLHTHYV